MTFLRSKKGNAFSDSLLVLAILVVFGLLSMVGYTVLKDLNSEIQSSDDFNANTKANIGNLNSNYPSFMDYLFLTVLVLLLIATVVFSYLVDTYPVFFIVTIIVTIIVLFIAGILTNSYDELAGETLLDTNAFPITNYVLSNLILVVVVFALAIGLALYGKNRISGGY